MYRIILFIALSIFAVSEGCQPPPCHWTDPKPIEDYFLQVANIMIAADRKLQAYCNQNGGQRIQEVHKLDKYSIVYPLAEGDSFDIRVRNRLLFVNAQYCSSSVVDVRVLPPYVDGRAGSYLVEEGDLTITFPYKFDPSVGGGSCIPPDGNYIILPQGSSGCGDDCNGVFS